MEREEGHVYGRNRRGLMTSEETVDVKREEEKLIKLDSISKSEIQEISTNLSN